MRSLQAYGVVLSDPSTNWDTELEARDSDMIAVVQSRVNMLFDCTLCSQTWSIFAMFVFSNQV